MTTLHPTDLGDGTTVNLWVQHCVTFGIMLENESNETIWMTKKEIEKLLDYIHIHKEVLDIYEK